MAKTKPKPTGITIGMRSLPTEPDMFCDNFRTHVFENDVQCEPTMYDTLRLTFDKLRAYLEVKGLEIDELGVTTRQIAKPSKRSNP